MNPEVVLITPSTLSYGGSMHQKHPPAKVASCSDASARGLSSVNAAIKNKKRAGATC